MITAQKTAPTYAVGTSTRRTVLPVSRAITENEVAIPFAADFLSVASPNLAIDLTVLPGQLTEMAHSQIQQYSTAIARIWIDNLAAHDVDFIVEAAEGRVMLAEVKPVRALLAPRVVVGELRGHCGFHSIALDALSHIAFTIKSVLDDWREVFGVLDDEGSVPIGVAYNDRLADYPPLVGDYEDIEVILGTEEDLEPRRYRDEDHQVWRP